MAPTAPKPPAPRKRTRKRKRRAASLSSSLSSSSSNSESDDEQTTKPQKITKPIAAAPATSGSGSDDSSSSSSSSSSESEAETTPLNTRSKPKAVERTVRPPSRSPSPIIDAPLPSFLPSNNEDRSTIDSEKQMREKFRQFWMESIVDGFRDDLEAIRKEPNFGPSRLALLIDSLASGAEVFASAPTDEGGPSEMDVVVG